ncbi:MAG TPA: ATP-binding protein [Telluria sp.]|nr:ATP-binding protein [Telluria sp.]
MPSADALYDGAACGLLAAGTDGVILRANTTLCGWLGYQQAELEAMRVEDLLTMGARLFHQTHCAPLLQMQGSVAELQIQLRHKDGSRVPVLMNVVRNRSRDTLIDKYAFFIVADRRSYERELLAARKVAEASLGARRDAEAELRRINEQLSCADRSKDEFLATLAHELRNPLAPMRNALEILKMKSVAAHGNDRLLEIFDRQLYQLTHLVDDLMEVSRITQGRMELRRTPLPLAAVMQSAVADVEGMIESCAHRLHLSLPDETLVVDADLTRLTQVITNLLTNACKYTPGGGDIWLSGASEGEVAVISVRDTGIGIPEDALSSIFEMFSQLEPALTRSRGGLGIGLALVRGLVDLHGGTVSASSAGTGQGSEFVVRLPLTRQAVAAGEEQAPRSAGERQRVLVVDDNADAADTLSMALELHGYEAGTAYTAESGLELAAASAPRVALLDIGLPDMNGYELARRIRTAPWGKDIVLIAATGWGQASDKQRARDAGFDHHLTKPIDFEALSEILTAALSRVLPPPKPGTDHSFLKTFANSLYFLIFIWLNR